jgi:hypothetical protein
LKREFLDKNAQVREFVMEITNNQIKDNNPPVTRETYDRLIAEGFSDNEAKELISHVIWAEVYIIMKNQKPFNLERFTTALEYLPKTPWDKD